MTCIYTYTRVYIFKINISRYKEKYGQNISTKLKCYSVGGVES